MSATENDTVTATSQRKPAPSSSYGADSSKASDDLFPMQLPSNETNDESLVNQVSPPTVDKSASAEDLRKPESSASTASIASSCGSKRETPSVHTSQFSSNSALGGSADGQIRTSRVMADPSVVRLVHCIIRLLQTFGPMTQDQLEFNLPSMEVVNSSKPTEVGRGRNKLQMVLELLTVLGAIDIVDEAAVSTSKSSSGLTVQVRPPTLAPGSIAPSESPLRRYVFSEGVPRSDVVFPTDIIAEFKDTHEEIQRTKQRIAILRNELRIPSDEASPSQRQASDIAPGNGSMSTAANSSKHSGAHRKASVKQGKSAREVLKLLLTRYPEVAYDPVYVTALRNVNVDVGAASGDKDRDRSSSTKRSVGNSAPSSASKKRKPLVKTLTKSLPAKPGIHPPPKRT